MAVVAVGAIVVGAPVAVVAVGFSWAGVVGCVCVAGVTVGCAVPISHAPKRSAVATNVDAESNLSFIIFVLLLAGIHGTAANPI